MSRRHVIGPTSAMSYPLAVCLAWAALNNQRRARMKPTAGDNAHRLWSAAEQLGLVVQ